MTAPLSEWPEAVAQQAAKVAAYGLPPTARVEHSDARGARRTLGAWRRTVKHPADLLDALGRSWSVLTADTQAALALLSGAS